jgi:hypothetical protein
MEFAVGSQASPAAAGVIRRARPGMAFNSDDIRDGTATLLSMRLVLALLAVIGLLTSPATAAARGACHDRTMIGMAMSDMPGMARAAAQKADPCCDPAHNTTQDKTKRSDCAGACAAMCGVIAALPSAPVVLIAPPDRGAPQQARVASLKPHEPSRLERPPRSIA